jgi:arylsulfatase A-like enzyme
MPEILKKNGVYTHLASDHYHYWEDGGATYHSRYSSWEVERGQEGDAWKGEVADPVVPEHRGFSMRQDWVNRTYMRAEKDFSQTRTFDRGLEFIRTNACEDNWFLQIECFDPHPPFQVPQRFLELYPSDYQGPLFDWPHYAPVAEDDSPEAIAECRRRYAALVSFCDFSLGRVLDAMDQENLWEDTLLIVTTDHGFLLGEHGWWAFVNPPFYNPVSCKPLFIWDPRCGKTGERRQALVQTHDLPATLLDFFCVPRPSDMQGVPLAGTIRADAAVRDGALFGVFGGQVNVTDGRYVYMRAPPAPDNRPLHNYTLMPTHMKRRFSPEELATAQLVPPFSFSKGCPLLKVPAEPFMQQAYSLGNLLFDTQADPEQKKPLNDREIEARMIALMRRLMKENDAPEDQYMRLGLT